MSRAQKISFFILRPHNRRRQIVVENQTFNSIKNLTRMNFFLAFKLARRTVMIRADIFSNEIDANIIEATVADKAIRYAVRRIKLVPILTETANHDDGTTYGICNP